MMAVWEGPVGNVGDNRTLSGDWNLVRIKRITQLFRFIRKAIN